MCGIVGYVGKKQAVPILLEGLRRLEYRGYDSAGLALFNNEKLHVRKKKGKIDEGLAKYVRACPLAGDSGVGHTRWATHGPPSDENSHPHFDQTGRIALVHNGVIENYDRLKERLVQAGHTFLSATDSEVLAHLVGEHYLKLGNSDGGASAEDSSQAGIAENRGPGATTSGNGSSGSGHGNGNGHPNGANRLVQAVTNALRDVIGTYGIAVISADHPGWIVGARRGSPLIVGVGQGEHFVASDVNAIVAHTRQVVYLNDYDVVTLSADQFNVTNLGSDTANVQISQIEFSPEASERGKFPHYMLKEIFEQPTTVRNAMRGRIDHEEATAKFGGLNMSVAELRAVDQIVLTACGTSWHAALVAEYLIEEFAHIPVEVEYASEFRYRHAPLEKNTLVIAITQSGETADTLAGLRESKRRGHKVLSICNVVGSTIAREADGGIYLHAGPEIGVASTKAFTSQVTVLSLLALLMGRIRMLPLRRGQKLIRSLEAAPEQIERILAQDAAIRSIALKYAEARNFFFLGRQYNFPVALEGALKLKEISYIHAEGYPAAEMKHGPIALIDEDTPSVIIAPRDSMYEKTMSNLQEVRARKGPVIAIASEEDAQIEKVADDVIRLPNTLEPIFPLLAVIPLQLLAYHIAVARGCDVDKPRNLAKSVTVE